MSRMQKATEHPMILIVEDDEATGEVISLVIDQETPYRPHVVTSGQEAMQALQIGNERPGLLILDYRLPDTTGVELYESLQHQHHTRNIPALLMSATNRREEIEPRDLPIMEKPFELDEFLLTIEKLITQAPAPVEPVR